MPCQQKFIYSQSEISKFLTEEYRSYIGVEAGSARPKISTALVIGTFRQANPAPTVFGKRGHPFSVLNERALSLTDFVFKRTYYNINKKLDAH